MSKSMMGAAGGGKVTVEGLSAEVILADSVVTVKQGAKEIAKATGTLRVLAGGGGDSASFSGTGGKLFFWNGSQYVEQDYIGTITFQGTPVVAYACFRRGSITFGDKTLSSTQQFTFNGNKVTLNSTVSGFFVLGYD